MKVYAPSVPTFRTSQVQLLWGLSLLALAGLGDKGGASLIFTNCLPVCILPSPSCEDTWGPCPRARPGWGLEVTSFSGVPPPAAQPASTSPSASQLLTTCQHFLVSLLSSLLIALSLLIYTPKLFSAFAVTLVGLGGGGSKHTC